MLTCHLLAVSDELSEKLLQSQSQIASHETMRSKMMVKKMKKIKIDPKSKSKTVEGMLNTAQSIQVDILCFVITN